MKKMKLTQKRAIALFTAICICLSGIVFRIKRLQSSEYALAALSQIKRTVLVDESRGAVYDRNAELLVNTKQEELCAFISTAGNRELVNEISLQNVKDTANGVCAITRVSSLPEDTETVKGFIKVTRYDNPEFMCHILGYTDASGRGVSGIERSFDKILTEASGKLSVGYSANAREQAIIGQGIEIMNDNYASQAGIVLTVDKQLQQITEEVMKESGIKKGAAVVMAVHSGEILAGVSLPMFSRENLGAAFTDENLPFLNRLLCAYPVGSVFKPFVAASAISEAVPVNSPFECTGEYTVDSISFHCYHHNAHGTLNLTDAVCRSCNCYFINLALQVGAGNLLELCNRLRFGFSVRLTEDLTAEAGVLPKKETLTGAALANFAFGQGEFTATPLQLAAAYSVIANGGIYYEPTLLKYLTDESGEVYAYYENEISYRVLDEGVCGQLAHALYRNMLEGTGVTGKPATVSAAGKTATAQTGDYDENGKERLCTWFCGYFPYENPKYTVVILNEDGSSASEDCAPVFSELAFRISLADKELIS